MSDARSSSYITLVQDKPFKVVVSAITLVSRRVIASITLIAFLTTSIPADLAWAGGTPSGLTSVGSDRATGPGLSRELDPATFKLPPELGTIRDSWSAQVTSSGRHPATVIHIQDAHCNYACQMKIAQTVEYLNKEYGVNIVNLEGGAEGYDLSPLTDIRDKSARNKASDYLVKEGIANGTEYFASNNTGRVGLWGIEDVGLYIENLKVYRRSLAYKADVDNYTKSLSQVLSALKAKIYSKDLLEFDLKYSQYKASNLEFKDYIDYIVRKFKERDLEIKRFPDLYILSQALGSESSINFEKANNERDSLIDMLQKSLSKRAMEELVLKTVEFRSEKLSQGSFYSYLVSKAKSVNIDLKQFPELQKYIVYISMYDAINKIRVISQISEAEEMLKKSMFANKEEESLAALSKNLVLTKNLFSITMTKEDYDYYRGNESSFDVSDYKEFIKDQAPKYGVDAALPEKISDLDKYRKDMSRFYDCSLKRDVAFLKNMRLAQSSKLIAHREDNNLPATSYELSAKRTAILITGGFHTENLTKLFRKNNISYISIMPSFTNEEDYKCPYYQLLSGQKVIDIRGSIKSAMVGTLAPPDGFSPGMKEVIGGISIPSTVTVEIMAREIANSMESVSFDDIEKKLFPSSTISENDRNTVEAVLANNNKVKMPGMLSTDPDIRLKQEIYMIQKQFRYVFGPLESEYRSAKAAFESSLKAYNIGQGVEASSKLVRDRDRLTMSIARIILFNHTNARTKLRYEYDNSKAEGHRLLDDIESRKYAPSAGVIYRILEDADIKDGDVILDPFGSAGNIAAALSCYTGPSKVLLCDLSYRPPLGGGQWSYAVTENLRALSDLFIFLPPTLRHVLRDPYKGFTVITQDSSNMPIQDGTVDKIFTDPPYGRDYTINNGATFREANAFIFFCDFLKECDRVLAENGIARLAVPTEWSDLIAEFRAKNGSMTASELYTKFIAAIKESDYYKKTYYSQGKPFPDQPYNEEEWNRARDILNDVFCGNSPAFDFDALNVRPYSFHALTVIKLKHTIKIKLPTAVAGQVIPTPVTKKAAPAAPALEPVITKTRDDIELGKDFARVGKIWFVHDGRNLRAGEKALTDEELAGLGRQPDEPIVRLQGAHLEEYNPKSYGNYAYSAFVAILALQALRDKIEKDGKRFSDLTFLDAGAGTGILGIAAAILGAKKVILADDISEAGRGGTKAAETARRVLSDNADKIREQVSGTVETRTDADVRQAVFSDADVLVMNMQQFGFGGTLESTVKNNPSLKYLVITGGYVAGDNLERQLNKLRDFYGLKDEGVYSFVDPRYPTNPVIVCDLTMKKPVPVVAKPSVAQPTISMEEVRGILKARNWYYRWLPEERRREIERRVSEALKNNLADRIKGMVVAEANRRQHAIKEEDIVSVMIYGGWCYMPEGENPSDIDIAIVVKGDTPEMQFLDVKIENPDSLFGSIGRKVRKCDIRIIGANQLSAQSIAKDERAKGFEISMWGHGIPIGGSDQLGKTMPSGMDLEIFANDLIRLAIAHARGLTDKTLLGETGELQTVHLTPRENIGKLWKRAEEAIVVLRTALSRYPIDSENLLKPVIAAMDELEKAMPAIRAKEKPEDALPYLEKLTEAITTACNTARASGSAGVRTVTTKQVTPPAPVGGFWFNDPDWKDKAYRCETAISLLLGWGLILLAKYLGLDEFMSVIVGSVTAGAFFYLMHWRENRAAMKRWPVIGLAIGTFAATATLGMGTFAATDAFHAGAYFFSALCVGLAILCVAGYSVIHYLVNINYIEAMRNRERVIAVLPGIRVPATVAEISVGQIKIFGDSEYVEVIGKYYDTTDKLMIRIRGVNSIGMPTILDITADEYLRMKSLGDILLAKGKNALMNPEARYWIREPARILDLQFPTNQKLLDLLNQAFKLGGQANGGSLISRRQESGGYRTLLDNTRVDVCPIIIGKDGAISANPEFNDPTTPENVVKLFAHTINCIAKENPNLTRDRILNAVDRSLLSDFKRVLVHNIFEKGHNVDPVKFMTIRLSIGYSESKAMMGIVPRTERQWDILCVPSKIGYRDAAASSDTFVVENIWKVPENSPGMAGEIVIEGRWKGKAYVLYSSRSHEALGSIVHQWRSTDRIRTNGGFVKQSVENIDDCSPKMCVMLDDWLYNEFTKKYSMSSLSPAEIARINAALSAPAISLPFVSPRRWGMASIELLRMLIRWMINPVLTRFGLSFNNDKYDRFIAPWVEGIVISSIFLFTNMAVSLSVAFIFVALHIYQESGRFISSPEILGRPIITAMITLIMWKLAILIPLTSGVLWGTFIATSVIHVIINNIEAIVSPSARETIRINELVASITVFLMASMAVLGTDKFPETKFSAKTEDQQMQQEIAGSVKSLARWSPMPQNLHITDISKGRWRSISPGSWFKNETYIRYWAAPVETVVSLGFGAAVMAVLSHFGLSCPAYITIGAITSGIFFRAGHIFNRDVMNSPQVIRLAFGTAIVSAIIGIGAAYFGIAGITLGVAAMAGLAKLHYEANKAYLAEQGLVPVSDLLGKIATSPEYRPINALHDSKVGAYAEAFRQLESDGRFNMKARRLIGAGGQQIAIELEDGTVLKVTRLSLDWIGRPGSFDAEVKGAGSLEIDYGSEKIKVSYYIQPLVTNLADTPEVRAELQDFIREKIESKWYTFGGSSEDPIVQFGRMPDGRIVLIDPYSVDRIKYSAGIVSGEVTEGGVIKIKITRGSYTSSYTSTNSYKTDDVKEVLAGAVDQVNKACQENPTYDPRGFETDPIGAAKLRLGFVADILSGEEKILTIIHEHGHLLLDMCLDRLGEAERAALVNSILDNPKNEKNLRYFGSLYIKNLHWPGISTPKGRQIYRLIEKYNRLVGFNLDFKGFFTELRNVLGNDKEWNEYKEVFIHELYTNSLERYLKNIGNEKFARYKEAVDMIASAVVGHGVTAEEYQEYIGKWEAQLPGRAASVVAEQALPAPSQFEEELNSLAKLYNDATQLSGVPEITAAGDKIEEKIRALKPLVSENPDLLEKLLRRFSMPTNEILSRYCMAPAHNLIRGYIVDLDEDPGTTAKAIYDWFSQNRPNFEISINIYKIPGREKGVIFITPCSSRTAQPSAMEIDILENLCDKNIEVAAIHSHPMETHPFPSPADYSGGVDAKNIRTITRFLIGFDLPDGTDVPEPLLKKINVGSETGIGGRHITRDNFVIEFARIITSLDVAAEYQRPVGINELSGYLKFIWGDLLAARAYFISPGSWFRSAAWIESAWYKETFISLGFGFLLSAVAHYFGLDGIQSLLVGGASSGLFFYFAHAFKNKEAMKSWSVKGLAVGTAAASIALGIGLYSSASLFSSGAYLFSALSVVIGVGAVAGLMKWHYEVNKKYLADLETKAIAKTAVKKTDILTLLSGGLTDGVAALNALKAKGVDIELASEIAADALARVEIGLLAKDATVVQDFITTTYGARAPPNDVRKAETIATVMLARETSVLTAANKDKLDMSVTALDRAKVTIKERRDPLVMVRVDSNRDEASGGNPEGFYLRKPMEEGIFKLNSRMSEIGLPIIVEDGFRTIIEQIEKIRKWMNKEIRQRLATSWQGVGNINVDVAVELAMATDYLIRDDYKTLNGSDKPEIRRVEMEKARPYFEKAYLQYRADHPELNLPELTEELKNTDTFKKMCDVILDRVVYASPNFANPEPTMPHTCGAADIRISSAVSGEILPTKVHAIMARTGDYTQEEIDNPKKVNEFKAKLKAISDKYPGNKQVAMLAACATATGYKVLEEYLATPRAPPEVADAEDARILRVVHEELPEMLKNRRIYYHMLSGYGGFIDPSLFMPGAEFWHMNSGGENRNPTAAVLDGTMVAEYWMDLKPNIADAALGIKNATIAVRTAAAIDALPTPTISAADRERLKTRANEIFYLISVKEHDRARIMDETIEFLAKLESPGAQPIIAKLSSPTAPTAPAPAITQESFNKSVRECSEDPLLKRREGWFVFKLKQEDTQHLFSDAEILELAALLAREANGKIRLIDTDTIEDRGFANMLRNFAGESRFLLDQDMGSGETMSLDALSTSWLFSRNNSRFVSSDDRQALICRVYEQWIQQNKFNSGGNMAESSRLFNSDITSRYNIRLVSDIDSDPNRIDVVRMLLLLLPESMLSSSYVRDNLAGGINTAASRFSYTRTAHYDDKSKVLGIQNTRFTARELIEAFLHEFGHVIETDSVAAFEQLLSDLGNPDIYRIAALGYSGKERYSYIREDMTELFAETFMHYILHGELMESGFAAEGVIVPKNKTIEEDRAAWKKIYAFYRDKVFGGVEYRVVNGVLQPIRRPAAAPVAAASIAISTQFTAGQRIVYQESGGTFLSTIDITRTKITDNLTYLNRHRNQNEYLRNNFIPDMVRKKKGSAGTKTIRIVVYGASTGEEVAALYHEMVEGLRVELSKPQNAGERIDDWKVIITGVEKDDDAVAQAEEKLNGLRQFACGVYPGSAEYGRQVINTLNERQPMARGELLVIKGDIEHPETHEGANRDRFTDVDLVTANYVIYEIQQHGGDVTAIVNHVKSGFPNAWFTHEPIVTSALDGWPSKEIRETNSEQPAVIHRPIAATATAPAEPMKGPGGGSILEAANGSLAKAQALEQSDAAAALQLLERAIKGNADDGVYGYEWIRDNFSETSATGRAARENLRMALDMQARIKQSMYSDPAEYIRLLDTLGVDQLFIDSIIKRLTERNMLSKSAKDIYALGLLLSNNKMNINRISHILQSISMSSNPKENAIRLSEKSTLERYMRFLGSCADPSDLNIGQTAVIFLNLPDNYAATLSEEELGAVLYLDQYANSWSLPDITPIVNTIRERYLANAQFVKLRYKLAKGIYDSPEVKTATPDDLMRAFIENNRMALLWGHANIMNEFAGKKYDGNGISGYELILPRMFSWPKDITEDRRISGGVGSTMDQRRAIESLIGKEAFAAKLKESGICIYTSGDTQYMIPLGMATVLSGYRGQTITDNEDARYLTLSLMTAIRYRHYGPERARPGLHELDTGLMMLAGRNDRSADALEPFAFNYTQDSLPDYARKRAIGVNESNMLEDIWRLFTYQRNEMAAKQNIYKLLRWLMDSGPKNQLSVDIAVNMLKAEADKLKDIDRTGLNRAYIDAMFGCLSGESFEAIRTGYLTAGNKTEFLHSLLTIQIPEIKGRITLIEYLEMEDTVRRDTFGAVADVSTIDVDKISVEAAPIQEIKPDTIESRRAAVTESFKDANGRGLDVRMVIGVPVGTMAAFQPTASDIGRVFWKNGYGVPGGRQIFLFEIDPQSEEATKASLDAAIGKAGAGLPADGRIVIFAPQMDTGKGPRLAGRVDTAPNRTVLPDAYTDYQYPDMNVRMAIARNVAYYYSSKQAEALDIIKRLLELTSDGEIKINTIDDLLKLIIRIRPIDYNKDIELYRNSQYQTAVSA